MQLYSALASIEHFWHNEVSSRMCEHVLQYSLCFLCVKIVDACIVSFLSIVPSVQTGIGGSLGLLQSVDSCEYQG
jgi:hypothetical protein